MNAARGPVIGIVGASYVVPRFWGELPVRGVPVSYVEHVAAAGGRPVVLPAAHAPDLLDHVDGIVLAGGLDIDPLVYSGHVEQIGDIDRERDDAEIEVARLARRNGIPLLGVCRGAQIMAVAFGGTLIQDLGDDRPHELPFDRHTVTTRSGSAIAGILGSRAAVNSLHHQAIDKTGPSWQVTAWADDKVIEAIEWRDPDESWAALGVQWHPELMPDSAHGNAVFGWLIEHAAGTAQDQWLTRVSMSVEGGGGV